MSDADLQSERDAPGAGLIGLLALVNAPAIGLVGLLFVPDSPTLTRSFAIGTLVLAVLGTALLYALVHRRGRLLRHALDDRTDQAGRLRLVLESVTQPILAVEDDGRVLFANAAAAAAFGYEASALVGQPLKRLLGDEADRVGEAKTDERRSLGAARPVEAVRRDGSRFPATLAITRTRLGGPPLSVILVHDVTELRQSRHAAEAASRSKDSLLVRVNHELRTPLTGILGTVDLLRDGANEGQRRRLDVIQELSEALLRGFEQMVDYARLEAGQMEVRRVPFSLRQTVEQALAPLLPLARARKLRLEVRIAPELHDHYEGDPGRVGQVLMNLVGNAIKFTPTGEVTVRVGPLPSAPAGGSGFQIEVSDTGVGIPADRLGAIFEPFEQADGSETRQHQGMGMGLSVASRLAALMGGCIEARSELGKGSRFRVELPLPAVQSPPTSARTVLVVLAAEQDRRDLERHLGERGIRTSGAPTGRQALTELLRAVVEGSPYGLVLIEEHLPDLSAREVLHRLRHHSDAPPAVLFGRTETDLPLPDGVLGVLPRGATPAQTWQAVLRALSAEG